MFVRRRATVAVKNNSGPEGPYRRLKRDLFM
jgi:hypothetical protein